MHEVNNKTLLKSGEIKRKSCDYSVFCLKPRLQKKRC